MAVKEHVWGTCPAPLRPPLDVIAACDVMYIAEAVPDLVSSFEALSGEGTRAFVAHGRNRGAEPAFKAACSAAGFRIREIEDEELDEVFHTVDVSVLELKLEGRGVGCKKEGEDGGGDGGEASGGSTPSPCVP